MSSALRLSVIGLAKAWGSAWALGTAIAIAWWGRRILQVWTLLHWMNRKQMMRDVQKLLILETSPGEKLFVGVCSMEGSKWVFNLETSQRYRGPGRQDLLKLKPQLTMIIIILIIMNWLSPCKVPGPVLNTYLNITLHVINSEQSCETGQ